MRNLYMDHFTLKPGTRVYVPTAEGKDRGTEIKKAAESRWHRPSHYFHLRAGGHIAAAREHHAAPWVASLDLQRFFDHISRSRVHRAMKKLGFSKDEAWEIACDSVVDKHPPRRRFSIPFGFVQSPILASVVLSKSALGRRYEIAAPPA
ncbi:MAG TPA: reverse transcriptase domain-containing protein [Allosphingosinicella sp.]|nr:reverse transcriptase domain-containing protein [Allosphingosinicella sp.]